MLIASEVPTAMIKMRPPDGARTRRTGATAPRRSPRYGADRLDSGRRSLRFDALAPRVGAEDVESFAALADELEGLLDGRVVDMPLDVEEEQVGGVAVAVGVGG